MERTLDDLIRDAGAVPGVADCGADVVAWIQSDRPTLLLRVLGRKPRPAGGDAYLVCRITARPPQGLFTVPAKDCVAVGNAQIF